VRRASQHARRRDERRRARRGNVRIRRCGRLAHRAHAGRVRAQGRLHGAPTTRDRGRDPMRDRATAGGATGAAKRARERREAERWERNARAR
jgi:hypothetical protein